MSDSKTSAKNTKKQSSSVQPADSNLKEKADSIKSIDSKLEKKISPKNALGSKSKEKATQHSTNKEKLPPVKLTGVYAFKLAMSSVYDEKGVFSPVTVLKFENWFVSQIKRKEKEGYNAVQLACGPQKNNRISKALVKHLSSAGFTEGALYVKEVRQENIDNIKAGQMVSIESIQKGDKLKIQAISKGHGFAGVVKRWGFKGGPASHGAKTHRTTGSIGNRTEPARVMPGKKMPGHYGVEKVSLKNVTVVDVDKENNLLVVKGPVPGARNGLVFLNKM